MEAALKTLNEIIGINDTQFRIPNFQRNYSWSKNEYERLYDDFIEAFRDKKEVFLGTLVVKEHPRKGGLTKLDIVDGQQRLTTIIILLCALRDLCNDRQETNTASSLQLYLVNTYLEDDDHFRLISKNSDKDILGSIILGSNLDKNSKQKEAYFFFKKKLNDIRNLDDFRDSARNNIKFVYISLKNNEDEYVIFECLNARGTPLTQPELINNLILMNIDENRRDRVYNKYCSFWNEEAKRLTKIIPKYSKKNDSDFLSDFFFTFYKSFKEIKIRNTYSSFNDEYSKKDMDSKIKYLDEIKRAFEYYIRLFPSEYPKDSNNQIDKILYRISKLDSTACYPFFLAIFEQYEYHKSISDDLFLDLLKATENYIVRNLLHARKTNGFNKVFISLAAATRNSPEQITPSKIAGSPPYPSDDKIKRELLDFNSYKGLNRSLVPIFQAVEEHLSQQNQHDETHILDESYQIEHICPQKSNDANGYNLSEEEKETLINTIGNLTLIKGKNNAAASNKSFKEKKDNYNRSGLAINSFLRDPNLTIWDAEAIKNRTRELTELLLEIYPDLRDPDARYKNKESTIKVKAIRINQQEFKISTWKEGFCICIERAWSILGEKILSSYKLKGLFSKYPSTSSTRYEKLKDYHLYYNVNHSSESIRSYCIYISELIEEKIEWIGEDGNVIKTDSNGKVIETDSKGNII